MQTIKVIGRVLQIGAGVKLRLSKSQVDARAHALQEDDKDAIIKNGLHVSTKVLEFKRGEILEVDMNDIPKNMRDDVEITVLPSEDAAAAPSKPPRKEKAA